MIISYASSYLLDYVISELRMNYVKVLKIEYILSNQGSFNDYVDKKRWAGGQKFLFSSMFKVKKITLK